MSTGSSQRAGGTRCRVCPDGGEELDSLVVRAAGVLVGVIAAGPCLVDLHRQVQACVGEAAGEGDRRAGVAQALERQW